MPTGPGTDWVVEPLTPELWPAFEDLLAGSGPGRRCWCMYWRIGASYRKRASEQNRADFHEVVSTGPPPGLLAFRDDVAIGWCQVTARKDVPTLDGQWRLIQVDDVPVWAITCFYVRRGHRREGVTAALIDAAADLARAAGAPALEAYPLDATLSPSATSTGYLSTFERAGFVSVARRSPERPVMRLALARNER